MNDGKDWLKHIGKAVYHRGLKALCGVVPLGEFLFEVAADVYAYLRPQQSEEDLHRSLQELVQAPHAEVKAAAAAVADELAFDQPAPVRDALSIYLSLIPAISRQSLKRLEDPTGTTVPADLPLRQPVDLLPLLPQRLPRHHSGQRIDSLGDWELVELLGTGGFGEVWKVRHLDFQNNVAAVKFCLDPASQDRLLHHEARILNQVMDQGGHPGIVPLLDARLKTELPWLKYEYVPGGDLTALAPALKGPGASGVIQQLAEIVGHFHRLNPPIVHRDLKPSNILVQPLKGGSFRLRVADFGIGDVAASRALRGTIPSCSQATLLRGAHTPLYACRQQKLGAPPDVRDDVYSLGVIWYQLLTGDLASEGPMGMWVEELEAMGLSQELLRLLGRCVAAQPEKRPTDAAELAQELDRLLVRPQPLPPLPPPRKETLAEKTLRIRQQIQQAHETARIQDQTHCYAEAVAALDALPQHQREPDLYLALCRKRDRADQLRHEIETAIEFGRLDTELRCKLEELLELVPGDEELRQVLATLPRPIKLITNSIGLKLTLIPAGKFLMGSPASEADRGSDEGPQHEVILTQDFYLGSYPVTQREYEAVMGKNPAYFHKDNKGGPDHPVECVSWEEVNLFCKRLSSMPDEQAAGRSYRLPTEAEWEYACRAGTTTPFWFGTTASTGQANFDGRRTCGGASPGLSLQHTSQVGSYPANPWGLCDLHGNVWEWCLDWYDGSYSIRGDNKDPKGPPFGQGRVLRGGSWSNDARYCRLLTAVTTVPATATMVLASAWSFSQGSMVANDGLGIIRSFLLPDSYYRNLVESHLWEAPQSWQPGDSAGDWDR